MEEHDWAPERGSIVRGNAGDSEENVFSVTYCMNILLLHSMGPHNTTAAEVCRVSQCFLLTCISVLTFKKV